MFLNITCQGKSAIEHNPIKIPKEITKTNENFPRNVATFFTILRKKYKQHTETLAEVTEKYTSIAII